VIGLRLALVGALRELDRPPRPGQYGIRGEVPFELLRRLDAEPAGGGVQEALAILLLNRIHVAAGVLARLPVWRELPDRPLGKIVNGEAICGDGGRDRDEKDEPSEDGAQRPRRHHEWTSWSTTWTSWPTVRHSFTTSHDGA